MSFLAIRHVTTYRYANPVNLGDHRMMLRPRDSHDLRLLGTRLNIEPQPSSLRWLYDVFGNSIAIASFSGSTTQLRFESAIELEHFESTGSDCPLETYAETFPFSYSADEVPDLTRCIERHYSDPLREVDLWARRFERTDGRSNTLPLLTAMTQFVKQSGFKYIAREAEGVQIPAQTLRLRSGTCRDFALLMMEGARALGLAARFVSGYVYSPAADDGNTIHGGSTHAWVQIYLPGSGWMEFDPTNGIVGNRDLIRVAIVRDPSQAVPISGSWTGKGTDFLGMSVEVSVTSQRGSSL
jgi:transglutaminase-like putative cysteine protease